MFCPGVWDVLPWSWGRFSPELGTFFLGADALLGSGCCSFIQSSPTALCHCLVPPQSCHTCQVLCPACPGEPNSSLSCSSGRAGLFPRPHPAPLAHPEQGLSGWQQGELQQGPGAGAGSAEGSRREEMQKIPTRTEIWTWFLKAVPSRGSPRGHCPWVLLLSSFLARVQGSP